LPTGGAPKMRTVDQRPARHAARRGAKDLFGRTEAHRELGGRLFAVAALSLTIDLVVTIVLVATDRVPSFGHGFIWTSSEMLTGGSGISVAGFWPHYLELGLQVWAVTAIAALAGSFGAFFHRVHIERTARAKAQAGGSS
jgi:hypothetical protein